MEKELKASVQYGDFVGELMCDGFDGPFLNELWNDLEMPQEYVPIAIAFDVVERFEDEPFYDALKIRIYACDKREYGVSIDDIKKSAEEKGHLVVKKFEIEKENLEKILEKIKRLSIIVINRGLGDIRICVAEE